MQSKKTTLTQHIYAEHLKEIKFWTMPQKDIITYRKIYTDTKRKIKNDEVNNFIPISAGLPGHVRPHGRKGTDKIKTKGGAESIKVSFWLNMLYVRKQVLED